MADDNKVLNFKETVDNIKEKYGARGFTAKKTAAGDVLRSEIKSFKALDGSVAANILSDLSKESESISGVTSPEELKDISKRLADYKRVVNQTHKNINDESKFSKTQADQINKLIRSTQKNVKAASKGLFGSANESFLGSLTETLNPFTKIGEIMGQLPGGAPFEAYATTLGEGINDKVKGWLGVGTSDEGMRQIDRYSGTEAQLQKQDAEEDYEDHRPKTEADTGAEGFPTKELQKALLTPHIGMTRKIGRTLGLALGLVGKDGIPFLQKIEGYLNPSIDASAAELPGGNQVGFGFVGDDIMNAGRNFKADEGGIADTGIIKDTIGTGLGTLIGSSVKGMFSAIAGMLGFKALGGFIKKIFTKIGTKIVLGLGVRGALVGSLAAVPIAGWIAAAVVSVAFGIFDGIRNAMKIAKDPSATITDKIFGFFDGFFSGILLGLVSPETIKKIREGFTGMFVGAWNLAIKGLSVSFDWIGGLLGTIWDAITGWVKGRVDSAVEGLSAIGGAMVTAGKAVWDFRNMVNEKVDNFQRSALRAILPRGDSDGSWYTPANLISKAIPEAVYKYAGIDKKTGADLDAPKDNIAQTGALVTAQDAVSITSGPPSMLGNMNSAVVQDNRSSSVVANHYGSKPTNDFFDTYYDPRRNAFAL